MIYLISKEPMDGPHGKLSALAASSLSDFDLGPDVGAAHSREAEDSQKSPMGGLLS